MLTFEKVLEVFQAYLDGNLTGMTGTAPKYRKLRRICETPCWIHTPTFWKIRLLEMTVT